MSLCPECSAGMMTRCVRPHAGAAWPLALPMIPVHARQPPAEALGPGRRRCHHRGQHDNRRRSRARAPEIAATRLEIIPNAVDVAGLRSKARVDVAARRRSVRALSRQARAEQGHLASRRRRRARGPRLAARDRRRWSRSRRDRGAGQTHHARRASRGMGRSDAGDRLARARRRCSSSRRAVPSRSAACSSKRAPSACRSPP